MPPLPLYPPDAKQPINNSLTWAGWILEFLPHQYYDPVAKKPRWTIPLGQRRIIPEGSVLHQTVIHKLDDDPSYKPPNLPKGRSVEPWRRWANAPSPEAEELTVGNSH